MLETPPKKFGRYEVREELGSGAMGVVYLAHDPDIGRDVAIKTIKRSLDLPSPKRGEYLERFKREAKAAGKLSDNPHIVPVFDVGQEGDLPYIVMAFVKGESLDRRRRKNRLDEAALEQLVADICSALGHAHKHGTIHRDVKPANILVTERGAMLTDFGIARLDGSELTRAGTFLGSPSYMSPEQVRGGDLTPASDLFSLAVILYLLLTEEKPFKGDDTNEILYKIVNEKHSPPSKYRSECARFDAFFERALAKQASERFADAAAFLEAFRRVVHGAAAPAVAATTTTGSLSAPTPVPFARSTTPEPRINPLEDRSFFQDFKSSVPTRRPSATDSGRVKFAKNNRRRGGKERRVPLAAWAVVAGVVLSIALLVYALRPSGESETKKEPVRERPAAAPKGKQREMIIHCPHCKEEMVAELGGRSLVACPACEFLFAIEPNGRAQIPTFAEEQSLPRVAARLPAQVAPMGGPDATHVGDTSDAFGTLPVPSGKAIYLEVLESAADPAPGTIFRFTKGRMILGRSDADVLLDDEKISRKHALIEAISRENIYLKDLASTNGTYLNGHRVMMKKLSAGDEITVGRVRLRFHMTDA